MDLCIRGNLFLMGLEKVTKILKYLILFLFIFLLILLLVYRTSSCDVCSFDYEGESINAKQFLDVYALECLITWDMNQGYENWLNISIPD